MKTYSFSSKLIYSNLIIAIVSVLMASCGSYQNSSYYDNDGIYGTPERPATQYTYSSSSQNNQYKDYFGTKKTDDTIQYVKQPDYNYDQSQAQAQPQQNATDNYNSGNANWGYNPHSTTYNYYDWGWNTGWGYSPYYYPYYPYYGWGISIGWGLGIWRILSLLPILWLWLSLLWIRLS